MKIQWNKLSSPSFVAALVILLVSMLSMKAVLGWVGGHLIKKPVPLRRDLDSLSDRFGPYVVYKYVNGFGHGASRLEPEEEQVLGTTQYITWIFRDTRLREDEPGALIRLHVPYYTGTIDSVPHVPDRCFVAGGATSLGTQVMDVSLHPKPMREVDGKVEAQTALGRWVQLPGLTVPVTLARFAEANDESRTYSVAYFFVANNDYVASPEGVRFKAFNLTDEYAYYCKIEVMPFGVGDPEQMRKTVGEFLSSALPEIMLCLPQWPVKAGSVKALDVAVDN